MFKAAWPVHFQRDDAVDNREAEHADPAQQNAPERARLEVHDEDLQTQKGFVCYNKQLKYH